MPPLLRFEREKDFRLYFRNVYCHRNVGEDDSVHIVMQENVFVDFNEKQFSHGFSEGKKHGRREFSWERAKRMNWVLYTLQDPMAHCYQGWDSKKKINDPTRQVRTSFDGFVVVVEFYLSKGNALRARFITCYVVEGGMEKFTKSPKWKRGQCMRALGG